MENEEKRTSLRLSGNLYARIAEEARTERRSVNSQIILLLEAALSRLAQRRA
jgi:hypothetical protein